MKHFALGLGMLFVLSATFVGAAAEDFTLKQAPVEEWQKEGDVQKVIGKDLYDLIDGFADIHMGFSFIESEHTTLKKGDTVVEVSVFRVDSPENAFGLYSCLRDRAGGEAFEAGNEASYAYGTAVVWAGPYVIEVKDVSSEPAPDEQIVAVAQALAKGVSAGEAKRPELARAFPEPKLEKKGMIYFHHRHPFDQIYYIGTENPLRLGTDAMKASGVEAVYADYEFDRGPQGILALRYQKPEGAAKALDDYVAMLKEDLKSVETETGEQGGRWMIMTARNGKTTIAWQKEKLLVVAFETAQPDPARAIIAQIAKNLEPKKKEAEKKEEG